MPRTKLRLSLRPRHILGAVLVGCVLIAIGACKYSNERLARSAADAWDSGDYRKAADLYEQYLERQPPGEESAAARLKLANIYYFDLHQHDKAVTQYTQYLSTYPQGPDASLAKERLADALADVGRSFDAIAQYESVAPTDDKDRRRIRLRIADLYFDEKNFSQALTEYAKVTDQAPYDPLSERAYLRQASIHQMERKQYQEAIPLYQKIVGSTADPKVRRLALYGLADCFAGLYKFDDAIKALGEIKDESERSYVNQRISELQEQGREAERKESVGKAALR